MKRVQDNHPSLAIKEACLARSGVYYYTYGELLNRNIVPKEIKHVYAEYRPPEVVARAKDKFAFAVVTKEHTATETNADNFRKQSSGVVGDSIVVREMDGGEIGLYGNIAFYTKDAYDYYLAGNKETSADYRSVVAPDSTGKYDYVLKEIRSVNGLAITKAGRGGRSVRVSDGGVEMKSGLLSFLGIGNRSNDSEFKLSKVVLDGARNLHSMDSVGKEKLVNEVMANITSLPNGKNKELLLGVVHDSLTDPVGALKEEEKVARIIDGLYASCSPLEDEGVATLLQSLAENGSVTQDAKGDGDGKEGKEGKKGADAGEGKEGKEGKEGNAKDSKAQDSKDSADSIEKLFESFEKRITDSMVQSIDDRIKVALNIKSDGNKTVDSGLGALEDGSFLVDGTF